MNTIQDSVMVSANDVDVITINKESFCFKAVIINIYNSCSQEWYDELDCSKYTMLHEEMLCYAQNCLFSLIRETNTYADGRTCCDDNIDILVDYCVIPKYDKILKDTTMHDMSVKRVMSFGYNHDEAKNILNGLNPDGSPKEELPF